MNESNIPKIIHQIWSGVNEPLPQFFSSLGSTWRRDYPDWRYEIWDNERIHVFIDKNYPEYRSIYDNFPYDIQRWDAVRYLILEKFGGMYVDFDYESIEPMTKLINGHSCCFACEPEVHIKVFEGKAHFNNALMLSTPNHPFMSMIINEVFSENSHVIIQNDKIQTVMNTTGPFMICKLYNRLSEQEKNKIHLIPWKFVSPLDLGQLRILFTEHLTKERKEQLEEALIEAYAVHYFFGQWAKNDSL